MIISMGFWSIFPPYSGYARAVYGSLIALSRLDKGSIIYLHCRPPNRVLSAHSFEYNDAKRIVVPTNLSRTVSELGRRFDEEICTVICEADLTWIISMLLARRMHFKCVWRMHALRSSALLHMARTTNTKSLFKYPLARIHEMAGIRLTDLTISLSPKETVRLSKFRGKKVVCVEPTYIPTREAEVKRPIRSVIGKDFLLFVGGAYEHNFSAIETIYTIAKKLPKITIVVAGPVADLLGTTLGNLVKVPHISDGQLSWLYENSIGVLIPLRWCVGVPMKLLEALYYGKFIVAYPVLASQLGVSESHRVVAIADNSEGFTSIIKEAISDTQFRVTYERNALGYFYEHLSPNVHALKMRKVLDVFDK